MDYLKLFQALPNLNFKREITTEDFYNPTLYKWDGYWIVSWVSDEGDSLLEFVGNTPEEAIENAVKYIKENYPSYYSKDYLENTDDTDTKLLFTLTTEEVEQLTPVFIRLLDAKLYDFVSFLPDQLPIEAIGKILTRIKQWQDENN